MPVRHSTPAATRIRTFEDAARALERYAKAAHARGVIGSGTIGVQRLGPQAHVPTSNRCSAIALPRTAQVVLVDLPMAREQRWYEALLLHEVLHFAQSDGHVLARAPLLGEATATYLTFALLRQWRPRASWTVAAADSNHLIPYEETLALPLLYVALTQRAPTGEQLWRWAVDLNSVTAQGMRELDADLEATLPAAVMATLRRVQRQQRRSDEVRAEHRADDHERCAHSLVDAALGTFRAFLSAERRALLIRLLLDASARPARRLRLPFTLSDALIVGGA